MIINRFLKKKINYKNIFLYSSALFLTLLIIYLIFPTILYSYITPAVENSEKYFLFVDWSAIIDSIKCKKLGVDVFVTNPCDVLNRTHLYGSILLFIPFFENHDYFYYQNFPIFINIIFILVLMLHFNLRKFPEIILFILTIFNPSTLMLMERLNIDIFIFLFLILLCFYRSNILNLFLLAPLTLAKFYPLSLVTLFFLTKEKKITKNVFFVLLFVVLVSIYVYFDRLNFIKIFLSLSQFGAAPNFAFNANAFKKIIVFYPNFYNHLLSIFLVCVSLFFIVYTAIKFHKNKVLKDFNFSTYEEILLMSGGALLILTYFLISNIYYREIYIFCLVPYLLKKYNKNYLFKFVIYFLIFRYLLFLVSNYYAVFHNQSLLLLARYFIDLCFISAVSGFIINIYIIFLRKLFLQVRKQLF